MSDISAKWTMVIYVTLGILLLILYPIISWFESRRQKRLLQIQADKRGEQVKSSMLVLPMGDFRLHITPHVSDIPTDKNNSKTMAILGCNVSDLSERVSHFPKIAVFRKRFLLLNNEQSEVRKKWKKFRLGNKKFDEVFSVYAENEADIYCILTDEIQRGLLTLLSKFPQMITDEAKFFGTSKMISDTNTYNAFIDTAISISEILTDSIYESKQTAEYVATRSDNASENLIYLKDVKEVSMSFLKNLFGQKEEGEPFVPTPTQSIPGLKPIIVQAIENLYPDVEDQKKAFAYALKYVEAKVGGDGDFATRILLAMLSDTEGKIEKLYDPNLWSDGHFIGDLAGNFPKMKDAEAWVKSITKQQS